LEDALEVKSRFLAIVSHGLKFPGIFLISIEMRTPLSGILGMLTLLTESTLDSQHKEMVHIASVCGEQLVKKILAGKLIVDDCNQ
jgi:signal transduction histidine kinase